MMTQITSIMMARIQMGSIMMMMARVHTCVNHDYVDEINYDGEDVDWTNHEGADGIGHGGDVDYFVVMCSTRWRKRILINVISTGGGCSSCATWDDSESETYTW